MGFVYLNKCTPRKQKRIDHHRYRFALQHVGTQKSRYLVCLNQGKLWQELQSQVTHIFFFSSSSFFFFFFFFCFLEPTPVAYGSRQARGQIRATAAGLHHSHSKAESKLCLQPTPLLMAMLDP